MSSSPTSPRRLPRMSRRAWQQELRKTNAVEQLKTGRYDLFPLAEVQALTDNLLRSSSTSFLRWGVEPRSEECNDLCFDELSSLRGEMWTYEAAIVAFLHVLSPEEGHKHLVDARWKTENPNEFFLHQVRAYLQCLVLAFQIRPEIFHKDVPVAAKDLLVIVQEFGEHQTFPSVLRVLQAVTSREVIERNSCAEFLPMSLVQNILKHTSYRRNLDSELRTLVQDRQWSAVYQLVGGVGAFRAFPEATPLIQEAIPDLPLWASWIPDQNRIHFWETNLLNPDQQKRLAPVLDLEGPDLTRKGWNTLRRSTAGFYGPDALNIPLRDGRYILDHVLGVLDQAVHRGMQAVDFFIALCVKPRKISWAALDQVEAALTLPSPADILKLEHYIKFLDRCGTPGQSQSDRNREADRNHRLFERMQTISHALPIIQSSRRLQNSFGHLGDLSRRGPRTLTDGQLELVSQLDSGRLSEPFAIQLGRLGRALSRAQWLHEHWVESYVEMLRKIPNEAAISKIFRMIREAPRDSKRVYCDALAATLGGCKLKDGDTATKTVETTIRLLEDPVWSVQMDYDRNILRDMLLQQAMRGFNATEATACLKQSLQEHDIFVRELRDLLGRGDPDTVCVHLTSFLGIRCKDAARRVKFPAECWRQLLLHMMRCRPPGLLERVAQELTANPWTDWVRHLTVLFNERHYDPEGGLGFTKDAFNKVSARKSHVGVGRMASTSTYSTTNSARMTD